jgi:hypothetical protein
MVKKIIAQPISLSPVGDASVLNAVICLDVNNQLSLLDVSRFSSSKTDIRVTCASALQAGPLVLDGGLNGVRRLKGAGVAYTRVMLAADRGGRLKLVIFEGPIDLYSAGQVLSGAVDDQLQSLSSHGTYDKIGDLSLWRAVNLVGGDQSVVFRDGRVVVGNPQRPMPSAIAVRTY